jgi:T5SS/PEP-CTERM-associated repeat protein
MPDSRCLATLVASLLCSVAAGRAAALTISWAAPASGSFSTPGNWSGVQVPGTGDAALFAVDGTYTVTFAAPVTNQQATVRDGDVTFSLGGFTYTLTTTGGLAVGDTAAIDATLRLANGQVAASRASLGSAAGSTGTVDVGAGGLLSISGFDSRLTVGSAGLGTLALHDGGDASVSGAGGAPGRLIIGEFVTGGGTVTVSGPGSTLQADVLQLWNGSLAISAGGSVTTSDSFLGQYSALPHLVTVTGTGSSWSAGDLDVDSPGLVSVEAGAALTATSVSITPNGRITVSGPGSSWTTSGAVDASGGSFGLSDGAVATAQSVTVGAAATPSTITGASLAAQSASVGGSLQIGAGGDFDVVGQLLVQGTLSVSGGSLTAGSVVHGLGGALGIENGSADVGSLTLSGGTLTLGTGGTLSGDALSWGAGSLDLQGGTASFPVISLPQGRTVSARGALDGDVFLPLGSTLAASGPLSVGDASSFTGVTLQGTLAAGANAVTLEHAGFARLGPLTTLAGGSLAAPNGVALDVGSALAGFGAVNARVASAFGSTIDASGNLGLGDPGALDGYFSDGVLDANHFAVTLNDRNAAVLGSLTLLGDATGPGTLGAANGLLLNPGKNIQGYGLVSADLLTNGFVLGEGPLPPQGIELSGDVTGAGDFGGNITFSGTYSPGNSPAEVEFEDFALGSSAILEIQLGGTRAGGDFDLLVASGQALLDGTLEVALIDGFEPAPGDTFEFLRASAISGAFQRVVLPRFGDDLTLDLVPGPASYLLRVMPVPEPGSAGIVAFGVGGLLALRRVAARRASARAQ